jgi:hypothetical protein
MDLKFYREVTGGRVTAVMGGTGPACALYRECMEFVNDGSDACSKSPSAQSIVIPAYFSCNGTLWFFTKTLARNQDNSPFRDITGSPEHFLKRIFRYRTTHAGKIPIF